MSSGRLSVLAAAGEAPDRLALIAKDRPYTFEELGRAVRSAAGWLTGRLEQAGGTIESWEPRPGIDAGPFGAPVVAVVAERTLETVAILLALFELGVPALLLHARLTPAERQAWVGRLGPTLLLTARDTVDAIGGPERTEPVAGQPPGAGQPPVAGGPPVAGRTPTAEAVMAMVPTSGSAGEPKATLLSRRAFLASAAASAANLGWEEDDRWLLGLPLAHVGGLSVLVRSLIARRCVVLGAPGGFDPERMAEDLERHRVTLLSLVPPMLESLLELRPAWRPPSHLRALLLGGGPVQRRLLERAAERGVPVLTTYGLTETCSQVTTQRYGTVNHGELGSGAPLDGVEVRIMDGEIQLRGPMLASGYLTSRGVIPVADSEGWLHTGDEGELDGAGRLHVRGRMDRLIVTGGENVDPHEVEAALESLESVRAAVVFGVEDPMWGQVVAVALVAEGDPPPAADLRERLAARLAPHTRPRLFCFLEALPMTAAGKVDRPLAEAAARAHLRPL